MKNTMIAGLLIIFVASCNKEVLVNKPANPTDNPTGLLSRLVWLDTTKAAPFDSASVSYYSYDENRRLTEIKTIGFLNQGTQTQTNSTQFFYLLNDSLPFKTITTFSNSVNSNIGVTTNYLTYNSEMLLLEDSSFGDYNNSRGSTDVKKFNYGAGRVNLLEYSVVADTPVLSRAIIAYNLTNNVNDSTSTEEGYNYDSHFQNTLFPDFSITEVHDHHKNPFKRPFNLLPNKSLLWGVYNAFLHNGSSENNIVKFEYTSTFRPPGEPIIFHGDYHESFRLLYEYNSDDFPVVVRITGSTAYDRNITTRKALFFY